MDGPRRTDLMRVSQLGHSFRLLQTCLLHSSVRELWHQLSSQPPKMTIMTHNHHRGDFLMGAFECLVFKMSSSFTLTG